MHSTQLAKRKADAMASIAETLGLDLSKIRKVNGQSAVTDLLRLEGIASHLKEMFLGDLNVNVLENESELEIGSLPDGLVIMTDDAVDDLLSAHKAELIEKISNLDVVGKKTLQKVIEALSEMKE